jgi:hypothetical protein
MLSRLFHKPIKELNQTNSESYMIPDVQIFWLLCTGILTALLSFVVYVYSFATTKVDPSAVHPPSPSPSDDSRLSKTNSILIILSNLEGIQELSEEFFGTVVTDLFHLPSFSAKTVYLCGDVAKATEINVETAEQVYIIRELSQNFAGERWSSCPLVDVGRVPINVHGVGVYYRRFFDPELDFFNKIRSEHVFQALTESNKPGTAHRTGIYLTPVEEDHAELRFRLLRCSSNLSGPTGNFRSNDTHIVNTLNQEAARIFENQAPLNHVLAQIYHNTPGDGRGKKATKAKIKEHSDKTKDMPENGLMAFVTFYDDVDLRELNPLDKDHFDYGIKGISGLTRLNFRLKSCVTGRQPECALPRQFSVTLYPNSVFFMPLTTNRLYTHEICPSQLDARLLPTRMGYVVRCSDTEAVHRDGHSYLRTKSSSRSRGVWSSCSHPQWKEWPIFVTSMRRRTAQTLS